MRLAPGLAVFALAGTVAYLGLAVLGEGGLRAFFAHGALVALAVALGVLAGVSLMSRGNLSPGIREDRGNRRVFFAFGLLGLRAGYLPPLTDRCGFWTLDGEAIRWLGVALFAAGGALRIWPVLILGNRFSGLVAIQPRHEPVTAGLYGIIAIRAILGCSSTPSAGVWPFARDWASCSRSSCWRRFLLELPRRNGCCKASSAVPTTPIVAAQRASFPGSTARKSTSFTISLL